MIKKLTCYIILLMGILCMVSCSDKKEDTTSTFSHFDEVGIKSLIHRYYTVYEKLMLQDNFADLYADMLAEDFILQTPFKTIEGKRAAIDNFKLLDRDSMRVHDNMRDFSIKYSDNNLFDVSWKMDVTETKNNQLINSMIVEYKVKIERFENGLFKFKKQDANFIKSDFNKKSDAELVYSNHRLRSVVNFWLTAFENNPPSANALKEVLSMKNFSLKFSSMPDAITNYDDFIKWFESTASQVKDARHEIKEFNFKYIDNYRWQLDIIFDYFGKTLDDKNITGVTSHNWIVKETTQRFPVIEKINVETLQPFQIG